MAMCTTSVPTDSVPVSAGMACVLCASIWSINAPTRPNFQPQRHGSPRSPPALVGSRNGPMHAALAQSTNDRLPRVERRARVRPAPLPASVRPTVSVVIPCFNYAHFLPLAVHSALGQQGVDVEVIVVDDASTDASLQVASDLAAEHVAVTVLSHATNQGPVATFNDGLQLASGEFLVR